MSSLDADAVVVGSGPNGLAAAIEIARAGYSVLLLEGAESIGGGTRSANLTLPGFIHDVCSAVHPLGIASPFFKTLPLPDHGLRWIHPFAPLAHPLDDGSAVMLERSIEATAEGLAEDGKPYSNLMRPFVQRYVDLLQEILSPPHIPRHPVLLGRFGMHALQSAVGLANRHFASIRAKALFAGLAAHSFLPLDKMPSAAFGLILAIVAHAAGWPITQRGSQCIANALAAILRSHGGEIKTGKPIESLAAIPKSRIALLSITPRQFLQMLPHRPRGIYERLLTKYQYGPGVFKIDYALNNPIPWTAAECLRAGTVHLGGTMEEIARSESDIWRGKHPDHPFVLLAQQSLFDPTRAPSGMHTAWAYCHVPNGSRHDMTNQIECQIERFAPGFRDTIVARHTRTAADYEVYNPSLIGGDINGGVFSLAQMLFRPVLRLDPYKTSIPNLLLCSSSAPPGGGVHGMCGYHAAQSALKILQRQ